jgi:tetratricopeptide (TPR) repeat protein
VFADGLGIPAAAHVGGPEPLDQLTALDLLDSLVRKSLVTVERVSGQTRYGLLETIRQFAEEQLESRGLTDEVRHLHAAFFAAQAAAAWQQWNGPEQRPAIDWVERELADLRAAFRWSTDHDQLSLATAIAAHSAMLAFVLQRFEPVGWAEELIPAAIAADLPELPQLYIAGGVCSLTGRPDTAVEYSHAAIALEADPRRVSFEPGWAEVWEVGGHRYAGRIERSLEMCAEMVARQGVARLYGLVFLAAVLPALGRSEEARSWADEAVAEARARRNPFWIAFAKEAFARAQADKDPGLAMDTMDEVLDYCREHRLRYFEVNTLREIAGFEAVLGDPEQALELFDKAVALYHQAGNHGSLATTLAMVARLFSQLGRTEIAATVYGMSTRHGISLLPQLPQVIDELRAALGEEGFERRVAAGSALEFDDALRYVREEIAVAQRQLAGQP